MSQAIKERLAANTAAMRSLADAIEKDGLTDEHRAESERLKAEIRKDEDALAIVEEARKMPEAAPVAPAASQDALRMVAKPSESRSVEIETRSPYAAENRKISFFADQATLTDKRASDAEISEARQRLLDHFASEGDEASAREVRAYSVGTSSEGGYLAPPSYLQEMFADYLTSGRPTADVVGKMPIPTVGQTFYIPTQTGAAAVAVFSENATITETDATFGQVQIDAARLGGAATMPNFLVDRSYPGADQIVLKELAKQYAYQVNQIVLNSSTSNRKGLLQESGLGSVTSTAGTATIANLWPSLVKAVQTVAAGVYGMPDAIVMHPRRWGWLVGQLDSQNRPVIGSLNPINAVASYAGITPQQSFQGPQAVGTLLGIPCYLDAGIPTNLGSGTDEDRIIVMKRDEPILFEGTPKMAISNDYQFGKDQLVARITGDVAFTCARRKAAVCIVSGTALNDTL